MPHRGEEGTGEAARGLEVKIDFDKKTATVKFDPDRATIATLLKATTDAGYPSGVQK